jgi:hypothetical protein
MMLDSHHVGCSSSPEIGQLIQALCKAQAGYKPVAKSEQYRISDAKSYWYSTWKDICEALYPSLNVNGLVFLPRISRTPDGWVMVGTLCHGESGEWVTSTCPIRDSIDGHGQRIDPQSFEIGCTYAKKTLLLTLAGGWAEGDEVEEQDAAKVSEQVQEIDEESQRFAAIKAKAEAALRLVAKKPSKLAEYHARLDQLVTDGDMRESDAEWLKEQYPVPEEKASAK